MSVSGETEEYRCPTAMPGQEQGSHWKHAWTIAKCGNRRIRDDRDSAHFNVGPLLKSTTGLKMEHLALLIRTRHERQKNKEELNEVDRDAAGGHLFPSRIGISDKVQLDHVYAVLCAQTVFCEMTDVGLHPPCHVRPYGRPELERCPTERHWVHRIAGTYFLRSIHSCRVLIVGLTVKYTIAPVIIVLRVQGTERHTATTTTTRSPVASPRSSAVAAWSH